MNKKINFTGFTLIELLVVITIIGLLTTFLTISIQTASAKARDAERLSDINKLVKTLALVASDDENLALAAPCNVSGAIVSTCIGASQPGDIATKFPKFSDPIATVACPLVGGPPFGPCDYTIANDNATVGSTTIMFYLERNTTTLNAGINTVTSGNHFNM